MAEPGLNGNFTDEDRSILSRVDTYLSQGLEMYRWWLRASATQSYAERFDLAFQERGDGSSYGFLDEIPIAGSPLPIVGTAQSIVCMPPIDPETGEVARKQILERRRMEVREFMMRYFMRVADSADPQIVTGDTRSRPAGTLNLGRDFLNLAIAIDPLAEAAYELTPLSWGGDIPGRLDGWGYAQLYCKLHRDGRVGKFPASETSAIIDVRELGSSSGERKYDWVVLRVRVFDFPINLPPFSATAQLKMRFQQDAYAILSPEFVVDEQAPGSDVIARYGWSYALINLPRRDSFLAYGPVGLGPGFMHFRMDLKASGEVLLYNVFAANQPARLMNVPLNPVDWGLRIADFGTLGFAAPIVDPLRRGLERLPFGSASFDPLFTFIKGADLLTAGVSRREFGISKEQLVKEVMAIHFLDCYSFCQGICNTFHSVACWTRPEDLPAWVDRPAWLDTTEYPFRSRYADVGPGRMHYVDEGKGEPVVMVHGNPDWSFSYRDLIKNLQNDYRCVAVDHIGFGLSDKPTEWDYLPESHSRNFERFVTQRALENVTLAVNDWGGPIGLSYAVRNPGNVARLVIMNSAMWSVDDDWYYRLFSTVLGGDIGRYLARRFNLMPRFLLPALLQNPAKRSLRLIENFSAASGTPAERKGQWVFPRQIIDSGEWLDEQFAQLNKLRTIPVLLIWGMKDKALIRDEFRRWQEVLPQAELLQLRNAAHYPHEDATEEVAAAMRRFFQAHPCITKATVQPLAARVASSSVG